MQNRLSQVAMIGVPSDLGLHIPGASLAPTVLRMLDLNAKIRNLGYELHDLGDLTVAKREELPPAAAAAHFLPQLEALGHQLAQRCYTALQQNRIALTLGGDHSVAIGSVAGVSRCLREKNQELGLVWIDAHADINTPQSSLSGNIHGMPVAAILGKGYEQLTALGFQGAKVKPQNLALIGIRALDPAERAHCKESRIRYYTMRDIDERGMAAVMREAIAAVSAQTAGLHVSFDLDAVDPLYAPGVSTPEPGGLSLREAHLALELLADTGKIVGLDFVEYNPHRDRAQQSAHLVVELIQSALGKTII